MAEKTNETEERLALLERRVAELDVVAAKSQIRFNIYMNLLLRTGAFRIEDLQGIEKQVEYEFQRLVVAKEQRRQAAIDAAKEQKGESDV